ncbi:MAG TPA: hypothetical protein VFX60_14310 [Micromonospora sp.]|nr:hypothetical protein [Micromonospora sp.]
MSGLVRVSALARIWAVTTSTPTMTARRRRVAGAILGWLALAATYYLTFPIFGVLSLFGLLVVGGCWLWAIIGSAAAVISMARHSWWQAVALTVVSVAAGLVIWHADWLTIYLKSQFWLHRGSLSQLAAEHDAGRLPVEAPLPWHMRYLSIDGHAHRQSSPEALYLPMWQDWRGESGGGFVYLGSASPTDTAIRTAPGGIGLPSRHIGDGWWWVAGG